MCNCVKESKWSFVNFLIKICSRKNFSYERLKLTKERKKNGKVFHFNNFFVILFSQAKSGMESIASKQQGNTYRQGPRFIF